MEKVKPRILYVEDDVNLSFVTIDNLEMKGYAITHCNTGKVGYQTFRDNTFDLCILDVMLPEIDGFELAKMIRDENEAIPIIFLSAKSLKEDRIQGLKLGGDDYITKPFSIEELCLKIEIFLKRSQYKPEQKKSTYQLGAYFFDFDNLELIKEQRITTVTFKEGELLRFFCEHPNQVLKREEILKKLWGDDDYFMGRSMDVFISRLRKYLKEDPSIQLENIHNVGFRLNVKGTV